MTIMVIMVVVVVMIIMIVVIIAPPSTAVNHAMGTSSAEKVSCFACRFMGVTKRTSSTTGSLDRTPRSDSLLDTRSDGRDFYGLEDLSV